VIVVADTSPINYLILTEEIDILAKMYGNVVIPRAVHDELLCPSAPEIVRGWMGQLPAWVEVHTGGARVAETRSKRAGCRTLGLQNALSMDTGREGAGGRSHNCLFFQ